MTPETQTPRERRRGWLHDLRLRYRDWWYETGAPIAGTMLVIVAVGLGLLAIYARENFTDVSKAASTSCERSLRFSPYFERDYKRRGVFYPPLREGDNEADLLAEYHASIPVSCP